MAFYIDDEIHNVMSAHLLGNGYVTLAWPKNTPAHYVVWIKELVELQLDTYFRGAQKKTDAALAADAEYESWNCAALVSTQGTTS